MSDYLAGGTRLSGTTRISTLHVCRPVLTLKGSGQEIFSPPCSKKVYGIPPEQVVGTAGRTTYSYKKNGKPFLIKDPKLLLNDNNAGKPEGIHFMIGQRPHAAFGNSTGTARCSNTLQPVTARVSK